MGKRVAAGVVGALLVLFAIGNTVAIIGGAERGVGLPDGVLGVIATVMIAALLLAAGTVLLLIAARPARSPGVADTGWLEAFRKIGPLLFRPISSRRGVAAITQLRAVFLVFLTALWMLLFSLLFIVEDVGGHLPPWLTVLLVAYPVAALAGLLWARSRPLATGSPEALMVSYTQLFFTRIAFAQSPAMVGFVAALISGALWPFLIGLAVSLVYLTLAAPSRGDVVRQQRRVASAGSDLTLSAALARPPLPARESRRVTREIRRRWRIR